MYSFINLIKFESICICAQKRDKEFIAEIFRQTNNQQLITSLTTPTPLIKNNIHQDQQHSVKNIFKGNIVHW